LWRIGAPFSQNFSCRWSAVGDIGLGPAGAANFTIQRLILIKATPVIHSLIGSKDFT
jgi:hypothetical protein